MLLVESTTLRKQGIDFINEDDARLLLFGFIEELTDSLSTYSHKHLVEI